MRGVVRTSRAFFFAFSVLVGASGVAGAAQNAPVNQGEAATPAETPAREAPARVILTPDADYFGFDIETPVRGATLDSCGSSCKDNASCRAFTFVSKDGGWCFLKSDFGVLTATPGATAGRLVATSELTPSLERQRISELNFLSGSFIDEARALAGDLKRDYDPSDRSYQALRDAAGLAYRNGNYNEATREFGQALALAEDNPGLWLDFAIANLGLNPDGYSDKQEAWTRVTAAAINAYLRADTDANRAQALSLMGSGFERRELWKPAYRAYRASLALVDNPQVRSLYDKVIAEHGFRITSHEVDADSANPRICLVFSDNLPVSRPDLVDYVSVTGGQGLAIEPAQRQICIDGVKHGDRYQIRVRGGLPAADGETLAHPAEINVYVRDRAPWVGFAGNAYVLPAGKGASVPIVSVNTDKANTTVYRIGDRGLAGQVRSGDFLRQLDSYSADQIDESTGELVWEGDVLIQSKLNENVITAIPIADIVKDLKPGVYVITAKAALDNSDEWRAKATQWFVVSDLGLTTLSGSDGLHAIVRSLSTAQPVAEVKMRLVAANDDVLGEAVSDADGHVRFDPGLARGTGGMRPQLVDATGPTGDYAFLDLSRSAFDLSDRGVDGRPAPGPIDVFLTPERGIYRPGETMHLTALVRDARANAVTGLPVTMVIERPDGVEFQSKLLSDQGLGGYSDDVALQANAMRGSWRVKVYTDPDGAALAETSVLVEDFQPERLAFEITTAAKTLSAAEPTTIDLAARYLYGAPAPELSIEGDVELKPVDKLATFPGYKFGLADDSAEATREPFESDATTDEDGKASFEVALPQLPKTTKPLDATVIVRLTDTNGRAVERKLSLPVQSDRDAIGIKPLFDEEVPEGSEARFDVIAVGSDGARVARPGLSWKLDRIETDYQWYKSGSNWNYELVTTASRVDSGTVDTTADGPVTVAAKVDWGRYRLTVEDQGDTPAATSVTFYAGYYSATSTSETPDVLRVSLDKADYRIGETAKLRLDPRFAGIALVSVIDDRLIAMKAVEVPEGGTTVDLEVTDQWGPGAYVTAALYRPMDIEAKRMPARALGLTWAKVAPGDRDLAVSLDMPDEMRPRRPMTIPVAIGNLAAGEEAFITVAAVDVGILNLTNFKAPAPDDWYFGQRKLGMEIRDLYGLLIDRMQGVPGTVRSGGDSGAVRLSAPPPTEKLVAFYSGIVKADASGKATVTFDIPDFNGTVRVMAMAWSKAGVGHAVKDVIVRDPVVVTASLPQFLNTGDRSRLLVEINNLSGAAGDYRLKIEADNGIGLAPEDQERIVTLTEKQRVAYNVPISGAGIGDHDVTVTLMAPNGEEYPKVLALGVRPPGQPVTRRNLVAVNSGGRLTVDDGPLSEFVPGTASIAVSVGGAGTLDVAGILAALDRYPYGCVEQLTSRALPLVYLDDVAITVGLGADKAVRERVQKAIVGVLADQDASGSFGLWGPYDTGNLWLDAYVTDFLMRAAERGYEVPKLARDLALENLSNRISYAEDFSNGGEDIAYALYVLARAGEAAIGDLRYYVENKLGNFATALAKAQIGAALSLYGDRQRATMAFNAALAGLNASEDMRWRADYGTLLRDQAAVLTLAAETQTSSVDIRSLATRIAAEESRKRYTSTQENAWMLLAAAALIKDSRRYDFTIDGAAVPGPLFKRYTGEKLASAPVVIENRSNEALDAVVSTTGVPVVPEPEGGNGFTIVRSYYTPTGEPIDIATMAQNDRVVVVLTVTGQQQREGHLLVVDPIPAGYEIENPNISASGDVQAFDWLEVEREANHTEARMDRFVAAIDRQSGDPLEFSVAYSMRAVSPGTFTQPAATVEDMYRPELTARTASGTVEVVGPTR